MANADRQTVFKQLAFIRYLYKEGVEQSKHPLPKSAISVLTFHDAVELFLHLASQYLDVAPPGKSKVYLMGYWDLIDPKLPAGQKLPHKRRIEQLNEARIGFKHHANPPGDVEALRTNTTIFLQDASLLVFGIPFEEVSLADLVSNEKARSEVRAAEGYLRQGNFQEAVTRLAVAFRRVLNDFTQRAGDLYGVGEADASFYFDRGVRVIQSLSPSRCTIRTGFLAWWKASRRSLPNLHEGSSCSV